MVNVQSAFSVKFSKQRSKKTCLFELKLNAKLLISIDQHCMGLYFSASEVIAHLRIGIITFVCLNVYLSVCLLMFFCYLIFCSEYLKQKLSPPPKKHLSIYSIIFYLSGRQYHPALRISIYRSDEITLLHREQPIPHSQMICRKTKSLMHMRHHIVDLHTNFRILRVEKLKTTQQILCKL